MVRPVSKTGHRTDYLSYRSVHDIRVVRPLPSIRHPTAVESVVLVHIAVPRSIPDEEYLEGTPSVRVFAISLPPLFREASPVCVRDDAVIVMISDEEF